MGGTGAFMSISKDSFENSEVGFSVGPLKETIKTELRRTVALHNPWDTFSENHRIITCQLVRYSMHEEDGCSSTQMAPMHHAMSAKIADLAAKHVPICIYSGEYSRHPSGIAMHRPCVPELINTNDVHTVAKWHSPPA